MKETISNLQNEVVLLVQANHFQVCHGIRLCRLRSAPTQEFLNPFERKKN